MSHSTPHYIYLKDGSLCNLNKRIARTDVSLLACLRSVPDPRSNQGKRHELALVLFILFVALLRSSLTLKDAHLWAVYNRCFLEQYFNLRHGLPDPTTISNILAVIEPDALVTAFGEFLRLLHITPDQIRSFDGKTIRALADDGTVRHILSLFCHELHIAVGQVGVEGKGKEIPAFEDLLKQTEAAEVSTVAGCLLLGDALHTQKATCKLILKHQADYLFVVKGNQKGLLRTIQQTIVARQEAGATLDRTTMTEAKRKRHIATTVTAIAASEGEDLLPTLTGSNHWDGVVTIGVLHRTGTRVTKDGTAHTVDETVGFISSRKLTAEEIGRHLRNHWCIENNLHWVKDVVFREDTHTLRNGNAPQVMSFLRSMVIGLCHLLKLRSISDAIHNLEKSADLHAQFLRMAAVV